MLKKSISFFIPRAIVQANNKAQIDVIERFQRSYILIGFSILIGLAGITSFSLRFAISGGISPTSLVAIVLPILLLSICAFYKKTERYDLCSSLVCFVTFMAITIRVAKSGGLESSFTAWYIGITALFGLILSPKYKLVFWGIILLTILFFFFAIDYQLISLKKDTFETHKVKVYLLTMPVVFVSVITWIIEREKQLFVNILKDKEKNEVVSEMVKLYNHEIINPINIAKGFLSEYRRNPREKALDKVEKAIEKIELMVGEINKLSTVQVDVEDYTKNFDHFTKIKSKIKQGGEL